jgi:sugar/nucleoside kinase (ribokinase family)
VEPYEGDAMACDVITTGRIGAGLRPLRTGVPLPRVTSFGTFPGGSLRHGPPAGRDPERTVRHADASGAVAASRPECPSATPTPDGIDAALAAGAVT